MRPPAAVSVRGVSVVVVVVAVVTAAGRGAAFTTTTMPPPPYAVLARALPGGLSLACARATAAAASMQPPVTRGGLCIIRLASASRARAPAWQSQRTARDFAQRRYAHTQAAAGARRYDNAVHCKAASP